MLNNIYRNLYFILEKKVILIQMYLKIIQIVIIHNWITKIEYTFIHSSGN